MSIVENSSVPLPSLEDVCEFIKEDKKEMVKKQPKNHTIMKKKRIAIDSILNIKDSEKLRKKYVMKRSGEKTPFDFNKILARITSLTCFPETLLNIDVYELTEKIISLIHDGITTQEIDILSSQVAEAKGIYDRDYSVLAGRILISNHQKTTGESFCDKMKFLSHLKSKNGKHAKFIHPDFKKFISRHGRKLDCMIDYKRDFRHDNFSLSTLKDKYLLKADGVVIERPQDMWMRVACWIHMDRSDLDSEENLERIRETYHYLSLGYFTHATPTLFNCGLNRYPQLASCFIWEMGDSIDEIAETDRRLLKIASNAGGIGVKQNLRCKGSYISSNGGGAGGPTSAIQMGNATSNFVSQAGGKRKGSFAYYTEVDHPDIVAMCELVKKTGNPDLRAPSIFMGLWICDLFMERVEKDEIWSLFDPAICPDLSRIYGDEYRKQYLKYEDEKLYESQIMARELWKIIFECIQEAGIPYLCFKDNVNRSNNQENIGVIKSSNLCTEIVQYHSTKDITVCNLASLCLPQFVKDMWTEEELALPEEERRALNHEFPNCPFFDFEELMKVTQIVVRNLNKVIDKNWYPLKECEATNLFQRPMGVGVQGLADVYLKFRYAWSDPRSHQLNKEIFECIHYASLSTSSMLSKEKYKSIVRDFTESVTIRDVTYHSIEEIPCDVGAYPAYHHGQGSPISKGIFHWEMFGLDPSKLSGKFDWETLRSHILKYGVFNSLLNAVMPTASTSQIMGNSECIEAYTENIFFRSTQCGDFNVINKYLVHELKELKCWDEDIVNWLKKTEGSIKDYTRIPQEIRERYKTVYEISKADIINQAIDRQAFIDQAQSLILSFNPFSLAPFTTALFKGWKGKLKTGSYYIRQKTALSAQKMTVSQNASNIMEEITETSAFIGVYKGSSQKNDDPFCLLCGS